AAPKKVFFSQLPDDADIHEAAGQEDDFVLTPKGPAAPSPAKPEPAAAAKKGGKAPTAPSDSALDDAPDAPAAAPKAAEPPPSDGGVAHSVATGGDALLDIARSEEAEG